MTKPTMNVKLQPDPGRVLRIYASTLAAARDLHAQALDAADEILHGAGLAYNCSWLSADEEAVGLQLLLGVGHWLGLSVGLRALGEAAGRGRDTVRAMVAVEAMTAARRARAATDDRSPAKSTAGDLLTALTLLGLEAGEIAAAIVEAERQWRERMEARR